MYESFSALYAQHATNLYSTRNIAMLAMMLSGKFVQVMIATARVGSFGSAWGKECFRSNSYWCLRWCVFWYVNHAFLIWHSISHMVDVFASSEGEFVVWQLQTDLYRCRELHLLDCNGIVILKLCLAQGVANYVRTSVNQRYAWLLLETQEQEKSCKRWESHFVFDVFNNINET